MTFITIFTIDFNDYIMSELKLSYIIEVEKASGSKFALKYDLNKSTINKLILEEVLHGSSEVGPPKKRMREAFMKLLIYLMK